jgi:hypothetical protein
MNKIDIWKKVKEHVARLCAPNPVVGRVELRLMPSDSRRYHIAINRDITSDQWDAILDALDGRP